MFHCLQIYIFVTDNRQFQYFTFLPHDVEILVKFTFLPLVVTLIVHLHFRRYTCCCSCIVCKSTFLPVVCIAYKFRFLPLAVTLHFAACSCIAYVFFCFANLHFCRLLVHCLSIYILSHTIVLCWNKRSIILPRPQGNNNKNVVGFILDLIKMSLDLY